VHTPLTSVFLLVSRGNSQENGREKEVLFHGQISKFTRDLQTESAQLSADDPWQIDGEDIHKVLTSVGFFWFLWRAYMDWICNTK
jgi:hypothetical protein